MTGVETVASSANITPPNTVRAELVEALPFFFSDGTEKDGPSTGSGRTGWDIAKVAMITCPSP